MLAQNEKQKRIIQLTGIVISTDSMQAVSYASVLITGTYRGTMCDATGYFSLVINAGDTLKFSSVGFQSDYFIVSDTCKQSSYSLIQTLKRDTLMLPTVYSRWPSYQQFKYAFEHQGVPEGDHEFAQKNLDRIEVGTTQYAPDASLNNSWKNDQLKSQLYSSGQIPQNNLLNPLAWAAFLKAWKAGQLKIEK